MNIELKLIGYHLTDGSKKEFECPGCGLWYPTKEKTLNCIKKFHSMSNDWEYKKIEANNGDILHMAQGVASKPKSEEITDEFDIVNSMASSGEVPPEVVKILKNRIPKKATKGKNE